MRFFRMGLFLACLGNTFLFNEPALADQSPKVEVFVAARCIQCRETIRFLDEHRIPFVLRELDRDRKAEKEYVRTFGHGLLPVTRCNRRSVRGFQPDRILAIVRRPAEPKPAVNTDAPIAVAKREARPKPESRRASAPRAARICSAAKLIELQRSFFTSDEGKTWRSEISSSALASWKDGRANDRTVQVDGFAGMKFGEPVAEVLKRNSGACAAGAADPGADKTPAPSSIECKPGIQIFGSRMAAELWYDPTDSERRITKVAVTVPDEQKIEPVLTALCEKYGPPNDTAVYLPSAKSYAPACESENEAGACRPHFFFAGYQVEVAGTLDTLVYHPKDEAMEIAQEINLKRAEEERLKDHATASLGKDAF